MIQSTPKSSKSEHGTSYVLWLAVIAALYLVSASTYIYLGMWRYTIFRAGIDDCIFTQVINSAFTTFSSTIEGSINHFLVHFSPILYFAYPIVKLFDGARGLVVLQSLLAAATIFPVWAIASTRLPKPFAFATTLIAAAYPALGAEAVGDFHELAFAPPLTATLVWAIDRKYRNAALVAAALLAMVKEDQLIALIFVGVSLALMARSDPKMRSCGLWIAGIGAGVAVAYFGVIRPLVDPHVQYFSLHFYEWWRSPSTPAGFAGPFSPLRLEYLAIALLPLAFLPLTSRYMIFALPGLAEVMLSHEAITLAPGAHYAATWIGYVLCAFADGTGRLYGRSTASAGSALALAGILSIGISRYFSPINAPFALYRQPNAEDYARERELESLSRYASIGTGGFVIAHLGMYPRANIAMSDPQDYLVFDAFSDPVFWSLHDAQNVERLVHSRAYRKDFEGAGIVILAGPRMDR